MPGSPPALQKTLLQASFPPPLPSPSSNFLPHNIALFQPQLQQALPRNTQATLTREVGRLKQIVTSSSIPPRPITQSHPQLWSTLPSLPGDKLSRTSWNTYFLWSSSTDLSPCPSLSLRVQYPETHFAGNPQCLHILVPQKIFLQATHSYTTLLRTRKETETKERNIHTTKTRPFNKDHSTPRITIFEIPDAYTPAQKHNK